MKHIQILLENGIKKRLTDILPSDKPIGIVLRKSKKVVSLNLYPSSEFSVSDLSKVKDISIGEQDRAEKDMNGYENTKRLQKYELLKIRLKKNEYLPSLGELKEAISELSRINFVRTKLGLSSLPSYFWCWSSSIRNGGTVWMMCSNGRVYWDGWNGRDDSNRVLAFLKI